ncbi:MAG: hypothetical protein IT578_11105 [Verrucomicrobiae bacterium]|nr:hypothetical protein [Verrucomicrobiae bacterium]
MRPSSLGAVIGFVLMFAAPFSRADVSLPEGFEEATLLQAVKAAAPQTLDIRYLTLKESFRNERRSELRGTLTLNVREDLYREADDELLGPGAEGVSRPVALLKLHRNLEILELPIRVALEKSETRWNIAELRPEPSFEVLGSPLSAFPATALVFGTSRGDAGIRTYQAAVKKAFAEGKAPAAPVKPSAEELSNKAKEAKAQKEQEMKEAKEKKEQETQKAKDRKAQEEKEARLAGIRALAAACTPFRPYEGMIQDLDGMHEIVLTFNRIESDGDLVTAELRAKDAAFQRRDYSGHFRQNLNVPSKVELLLIGKPSTASKGPLRGTTSLIQVQSYFVLTLDDDGNLVGAYGAKNLTSTSSASVLNPTPLNSKYGYPIRFRRRL